MTVVKGSRSPRTTATSRSELHVQHDAERCIKGLIRSGLLKTTDSLAERNRLLKLHVGRVLQRKITDLPSVTENEWITAASYIGGWTKDYQPV